MKLFIFILLSTLSLTTNNIVKTDNEITLTPLVCIVGNDYSYLLEQDGYDIVNQEVDFYHVGTYYITYLNPSTKEVFTRRVDVIDEQDFTNDIYYRYDEKELLASNYEFIDACTYNDKIYLLEVENKKENTHNLILSEITNNKVSKQTIVKENIEATFNKLFVDDEGIYILGTVYKEGYSIDLYALEVNFDLEVVFETNIGGSGIENLSDALLYGDYIYLIGDTTSSGGLFPGARKQEDGFVMKVSKDLFNVEGVFLSTLNNINTYQKLAIKDDNIYILEQYTSLDKVAYNLQINTLDLKISKKENFINSYGLTPHKLVSNDLGVYLLCDQYNYVLDRYATRIYQITDEAKPILYYDYSNTNEENKHVVDLQYCNNKMIILTKDLNTNTSKILVKGEKEEKDFVLNIEVDSPYKFVNDNTFITSSRSLVNYIYVKRTDEILINNEKADLSDKSNIKTDPNIFGNYQNIYVYNTDKAMFAYSRNEYIPLEVSVINNENFDNNLRLIFNGTGLLNNKLIDSGYIVNKPGTYELEIYGKDNERKVYNFTVDDLSNKDFVQPINPKLVETNSKLNQKEIDSNINFGDNTFNQITKTYHFWLLLIPIILLIVSLILLFRRKHEK